MYICTPATFGGLLTALSLLPLQHWPRRTKVGRLLIFACRWMTGPIHAMFKIEVQGVSNRSVFFKLTLTDRKMQAKICLKVVLTSLDYGI